MELEIVSVHQAPVRLIRIVERPKWQHYFQMLALDELEKRAKVRIAKLETILQETQLVAVLVTSQFVTRKIEWASLGEWAQSMLPIRGVRETAPRPRFVLQWGFSLVDHVVPHNLSCIPIESDAPQFIVETEEDYRRKLAMEVRGNYKRVNDWWVLMKCHVLVENGSRKRIKIKTLIL